MSDVNVIPLDDLLPHCEETGCWCDPRVEVHGANLLIIHNSLDGREIEDDPDDGKQWEVTYYA